jgi:hypothetical protein
VKGEHVLRIVWAGSERKVRLDDKPVSIGRGEDCDLQLDDATLSRQHARIVKTPQGWAIEDVGSRGATWLNGAPIEATAPLSKGDRIRVGTVEIHFEGARSLAASVLTGDPARDARNVSLLLETVDDLYGAPDLGELLRTIVDRAIEIGTGERGALLLRAGTEGRLERVAARDRMGNDLAPELALTRTIPARALKDGRAIALTDTEAPEQRGAASSSVLDSSLRSVLCVPLPGRAGPMGVLYVDSCRTAHEFGAQELAFFDALAKEAALAIERASLLAERERREAAARRKLETENTKLREKLGAGEPVAQSEAMARVLTLVRRVAPSDATVLVQGETGTGKEVIARSLHDLSLRRNAPFVVVDCGAIPETLIESELFGHVRGAFRGAPGRRIGRFEEAARGSVLLAGGYSDSWWSRKATLAPAELYDPRTGKFTENKLKDKTVEPRMNHCAVSTGRTVLLVGGERWEGGWFHWFGTNTLKVNKGSEVWNGGAFVRSGDLSRPRRFAAAVGLPNGEVFLAGGNNDQGLITVTEAWSPSTGRWRTGEILIYPRANAQATVRGDTVFVVGGWKGGFAGTREVRVVETFRAATKQRMWEFPLRVARNGCTATTLADGRILVAGGFTAGQITVSGQDGQALASSELYVEP